MKKLLLVLVSWLSLLASQAMADDLFPLDHVPLGSDANTVERLYPTIKWADFRMDSSDKPTGKVIATVKLSGQFWDGALLGLPDGRLESVGYANLFATLERRREILPVIFKELLRRYGKPDQVLACERFAMKGTRNAPLFLWRRQDRVIAFEYTPFAVATDGKLDIGLQVMLPDVLEKRYKVVEVTPAEMERLTVDVAGITMPPASSASGMSSYLWLVVGIVVALVIAAGFILVKKAGRPQNR